MGKAIGLLLVAVVSGTLLYILLRSGRSQGSNTPSSASTPSSPPSQNVPIDSNALTARPPTSVAPALPQNDVSSTPSIAPPRTPEERATDDLETKRGPFYAWIRKEMSDLLTAWQPSAGHPATLELYASRNDSDLLLSLQQQLVAPYAAHYGFNHVLFYLPNPSGSLERYRLAAEANLDSGEGWNLIRK